MGVEFFEIGGGGEMSGCSGKERYRSKERDEGMIRVRLERSDLKKTSSALWARWGWRLRE